MSIKFSNNASTTLASSVSSSQTEIQVVSPSTFPVPLETGDSFYVTLVGVDVMEIVRVYGHKTDPSYWYIERGQEGTIPSAFSAGDLVELRITAGVLNSLVSSSEEFEEKKAVIDSNTAGISSVSLALNNEVNRATAAEEDLQTTIEEEKTRAEAAEATLQTVLEDEVARAIAADQTLTDNLNTEIVRAIKADQFNTESARANKKRISNLEALLAGEVYTEATDSSEAYAKIVGDESVTGGAEVMPYAGVETIGGKTLAWNQLVNATAETTVSSGVTFTKTGNGRYTASGTAGSSFAAIYLGNIHTIENHKYLVVGCPAGGSLSSYYVLIGTMGSDIGNGAILAGNNLNNQVACVVQSGITVENLVFGPQLFDLTLMFGAGNEPTTVEEFKAMFPADYYDYDPSTLKSAAVTEMVSSGNVLPYVDFPSDNGITVTRDGSEYHISGGIEDTSKAYSGIVTLSSPIPAGRYRYTIFNQPDSTGSMNIVLYNTASTLLFEERVYPNSERLSGVFYTKTPISKLGFYVNTSMTEIDKHVKIMLTPSDFEQTEFLEYTEPVSLPIPAAVQELEGYGLSTPTARNWIDWEAKVYHREVGQIVYSRMDVIGCTTEGHGVYYAVLPLGGFASIQNSYAVDNRILCSHLVNDSRVNIYSGTYGIAGHYAGRANIIIGLGFADLTSYRDWVQRQADAGTPLTVNYNLETPELIDISDILPDDNIIPVQEGGVITFPNHLGNDYLIHAPSDVTYTLKLSTEEEATA